MNAARNQHDYVLAKIDRATKPRHLQAVAKLLWVLGPLWVELGYPGWVDTCRLAVRGKAKKLLVEKWHPRDMEMLLFLAEEGGIYSHEEE